MFTKALEKASEQEYNNVDTETKLKTTRWQGEDMMSEKKQFPTPAMLKAEEEWAKKSPEEKQAIENRFREKLRKYYANRMSREAILASIEEDEPQD